MSIGAPAGCTLASGPAISAATPADSLPAHAAAPLGVLRFTATGCAGQTLTVQITYPPGTLAGLAPYKRGPAGWFAHGTVSGDTVSYTVTDDGPGDSDIATPGVIADPFAPLLLAASPQAIPALSQWALLLLSALVGLLALRRRE